MSTRKRRHEQFQQPEEGASTTLSGGLVAGALLLLRAAHQERQTAIIRTPDNHYSSYAVGSIALLVDAFEAWLNEVLAAIGVGSRRKLREQADKSVIEKYQALLGLATRRDLPAFNDLQLLTLVRVEIAHYLPRPISEPDNVPSWLVELQDQGLFLPVDDRLESRAFGQRLQSYRLAYWAWETISAAVDRLVQAVGPMVGPALSTANNFFLYKAGAQHYDLSFYHTYEATDMLEPVVPAHVGIAKADSMTVAPD